MVSGGVLDNMGSPPPSRRPSIFSRRPSLYARRESVSSFVYKTIGTLHKRRYSEIDETRRLERALAIEDAQPPKSKIKRIRHKGGLLLHSKPILLAIVLLNLVDCALVLGELILDIHYIKGLVEKMDEESINFINKMEEKYPNSLQDNDVDHMNTLFQQIIDASCTFTGSDEFSPTTRSFLFTTGYGLSTGNRLTSTLSPSTVADSFRSRRLFDTGHGVTSAGTHAYHKQPHAHSMWEDLAHGLHKASITILGILFLENIMKVIFMGKEFLKHKLEVFDFFVVTASFVLDLVYLKGLTVYRIQDGILILSFLVPWRVIRVVNSLIVAVLDHEHFRLKMMYKRQKTVSADLKVMKQLEKDYQMHLKNVERFCMSEGMPEWKVHQQIHFHKTNPALSAMASSTLGSMLSGLLGETSRLSPRLSKKPDGNVRGEKFKVLHSWNSYDSSHKRDSGHGSLSDENGSLYRSDSEISNGVSNGHATFCHQLSTISDVVENAENGRENPPSNSAFCHQLSTISDVVETAENGRESPSSNSDVESGRGSQSNNDDNETSDVTSNTRL